MKIQDNIQDKDSHDAENVKIDKGQVKELRATRKIKRRSQKEKVTLYLDCWPTDRL